MQPTSPLIDYEYHATGEVISVIYHGKATVYRVRVDEELIITVFDQNRSETDSVHIEIGDTIYLHWRAVDVILLEN